MLYKKGSINGINADVGHGMIFKDMDGTLYLSIHTPNQPSDSARALFIPIKDNGDTLVLNVK